MDEQDRLAERFEERRTRRRTVAFRMLGSLSEADDAVQEAWLRLSRSIRARIENLDGWLTTVVARVCLNMLRAREAATRGLPLEPARSRADRDRRSRTSTPSTMAILADSVGLALLVVLDTLAPAERLAFVLHDMFAVPFDEIAPIIGRVAGRGETARKPRTTPHPGDAGTGHRPRPASERPSMPSSPQLATATSRR